MSSNPDEDAVWRAIVENYGEEPAFVAPPPPRPVEREEDHYVPPPPPPAPIPRGPRGLAWMGVLGVPLLSILFAVIRVPVPGWLWFLLLVWFGGGFVYLVATMGGSGRDGWDDGAVV